MNIMSTVFDRISISTRRPCSERQGSVILMMELFGIQANVPKHRLDSLLGTSLSCTSSIRLRWSAGNNVIGAIADNSEEAARWLIGLVVS